MGWGRERDNDNNLFYVDVYLQNLMGMRIIGEDGELHLQRPAKMKDLFPKTETMISKICKNN